FVEQIFTASTHSYLLIFTNKGRVHWTKVYRLPEGTRNGKGRPIVNFIELSEGEKVSAIVPVRKFGGYFCLVFATKKGVVNKMDLTLFSRPRKAGVNAITLDEGDELVKVKLVGVDNRSQEDAPEIEGEDLIEETEVIDSETELDEGVVEEGRPIANDLLMIATKSGQAITFPISSIRAMGRGTHGVRGIQLAEGDEVISLLWLKPNNKILTISENGYGKRSEPSSYRITRRGGKGVKNLNVTEKTGEAVFVDSVADDYDLIITSRDGQVIRISVDSIRVTGRVSQGVKAITLRDQDMVQDATALPSVEDIEQDSADAKETFDHIQGETVEDETEVSDSSSESSED
ncbi:MAG TPA: DNA gyrase C-terminal beta-propeller domain-containing protein, partial [Fibrobacteraceae bacterium]|nr:DNA gyrase C-terminal beta-propeller domain-containing protein [Fibrobacteraceae bacterium]